MGRKRFYAGTMLLSCALAFGGCLLPKEEAKPSILVNGDSGRAYELTKAVRGDIQKTKTMMATYQQVKTENLSFSVDGRNLSGVYVSVGDTVNEGDLLAELICDDEKDQLRELEYQIKTQEMQLTHLQEQEELELNQLARRKGSMSTSTYQGEVSKVKEEYRIEREDIEDMLYVERMMCEQLRAVIDGCGIYAGMDGTVTYMEPMATNYFSWSGRKVITVSAGEECVFECGDIEYESYFKKEEVYTFATSAGVKYETFFVGADENGGVLRFELTKPQYGLPLGMRVLYSLVLEHKEDVLYLPKSAVHYTDEKAFVYYMDSEGNRQMKFITVGMTADSVVEVVDGLAEGEEVILR